MICCHGPSESGPTGTGPTDTGPFVTKALVLSCAARILVRGGGNWGAIGGKLMLKLPQTTKCPAGLCEVSPQRVPMSQVYYHKILAEMSEKGWEDRWIQGGRDPYVFCSRSGPMHPVGIPNSVVGSVGNLILFMFDE